MKELHIIAPEKESIVIVPGIPEDLHQYKIAGTSSWMGESKFGQLLFHHFKGEGFDIWYSNYPIRSPVVVPASANYPLLEWHIPFVNGSNTWWEGLGQLNLAKQQFEVIYVPFVNTQFEFARGAHYHSFDIHFKKEFLQPYANHCPRLAVFLEKVDKGKPANLLDMVQFINLDMVRVIKAILEYKFHEGLVSNYFTGLVHKLLTLLTIQVAGLAELPKFDPGELDRALAARTIILADFEVYHTVEQLARKVGTSELKLQLAFKHLYGRTVFQFSREVRMAEGYRLLRTTDYPLRVICVRVG